MFKKFTLLILIILMIITLHSCTSIHYVKGGLTYRYLFKGAILYEYISDTERGDSVGVALKTELVCLKQSYINLFSTREYWKYETKEKNYFVDVEKTGYINYNLDDSLSKFGKLIVKTLIIEGENAGKERESMRVLILDTNIIQKGVDYAPTISADGKTLYFVSQRPGSKLSEKGIPSHDFWAVKKENKYDSVYSKPYNIDTTTNLDWRSINTSLNEGVATIAADGRTLYFTGCDRPDGVGNCDIYVAKIFEGKWSKPMNLDRNVNTIYWESQPSISPDMKTLYFASNRPGPNGDENFDIWYSNWDDEWDEWGPAINLSAINTKGKEVAPFIAADGVTLFFSSDGHDSSFGGLDFYVTKYDLDLRQWSKPAHLQQPINTPFDDEFISLPASGDIVYFSSTRKDIPGYQGDLDLYMAYIETMFRAIVLKIFIADDSEFNTLTSVTVDNPVSKRKVKDIVSKRDNILNMVLTNADYGRVSDSVPYIDLKIKAENNRFGTKQKIMRVKNPLLAENKGCWVFNNELDETFEMSVSPEFEKYLNGLKRTILDASVSAYSDESQNDDDTTSITIEEFHSSNTKPLLPYIFFDNNSAVLSDKYVRLSPNQTNKFTLDSLFSLGTLDTYYHLLDIIGYRMKTYPDALLNLTGCNSNNGTERGNKELSELRAMKVSEYLVKTWGIDSSRIIIEYRNLPANPSNSLFEDGVAENRRVECSSSDIRLLSPITTTEILKVAKPAVINLKSVVSVKGGEATWLLNAMQDGKTIKSFSGEGSMSKDLEWNLNKERNTMPMTDSPVMIELLVKDKSREKIIVAKGEIPVKQITTKVKSSKFVEDKKIDKFSLILFDFGKSKLNDGNMNIVQSIKDSIKPDSKLIAAGYSDRIGNPVYNQKLSEKRAMETAKALGITNSETSGIGSGILLYDNELPEGRFYCRTVEITVETPIKKRLGD